MSGTAQTTNDDKPGIDPAEAAQTMRNLSIRRCRYEREKPAKRQAPASRRPSDYHEFRSKPAKF